MKEIKEYLENQLKLSQELNAILKDIDSLENKEKELYYQENKDLRERLDKANKENITAVSDRISILKNRMDNMLSNSTVKSNAEFFHHVRDLNYELSALSTKLDSLEERINNSYTESLALKATDIIQQDNPVNSISKEIHNEIPHKISDEINKKITHKISAPVCNSTKELESPNKKLEFKFGANILNVIGVVLILISLITFGKYVYTNYMSDLIKGIFLFAVSGSILYGGEKIFKNKSPKFSSGISALGIGGLYASLMINYLVLDTLNSVSALFLTAVITGISLYMSYRNNCNVIRIISLLGAYICLYPMHYLYGMTSYITIIILIAISISNGCLPIKNKSFMIYSSIITIVFCNLLLVTDFLEEPALKIYFLAMLIINNFMYMKLLKEDGQQYYASALLSSLCFITIILFKGELLLRVICLFITIASYYAAKDRLRIISFINAGLTSVLILIIYEWTIGILFAVIYISLLALTTIYQSKNSADKFLRLYFAGLVSLGMLHFLLGNILEIILYGTAFAVLIWFLSDRYKNSRYLIRFKHLYLLFIIIIITIVQSPFSAKYNIFLSLSVSLFYLLLTNNVEKLKHDSIKDSNLIITAISFIICNLDGFDDISTCLISLLLGTAFIILLTSRKYIDNKSILKHRLIIYSLYLTYGICTLFNVSTINSTISNILLSIILMIISLINVWLGFKINTIEIRRYGLILSLIVCAKLLIIDFYSFNFVIKSILFLIIGIIALAISYIYSKLEHEIKNSK